MALLLFVVCGVVGGIILAAATVAGGRVSGIADMDKRYYAVTSAAQLLAETIGEKEVTIEQVMTYTVLTDSSGNPVDSSGNPITSDDPFVYANPTPTVKTYIIEGTTKTENPSSFISQQAEELLFNNKTQSSDRWECSFADAENVTEGTKINSSVTNFSMQLCDGAGNEQGIPVKCTGYVKTDGTLIIDTVNADDSDAPYTMELIMKPNFSDSQIDTKTDAVPISIQTGNGTETLFQTTMEITKSSTVSWNLSSIERSNEG
ncbi:MAG: hypothetical protein IKF90_21395 [Parasporobacterium sp.]|nr:hypothetical protein [Parasporobacterium sp.]